MIADRRPPSTRLGGRATCQDLSLANSSAVIAVVRGQVREVVVAAGWVLQHITMNG